MNAEQDEEFTACVERSSPRLLTAAWMLTGDPDLAEELVQETLAKAYRRWPHLSGGDPAAYTRRVLITVHNYRARPRRRAVLSHEAPQPAQEPPSRHEDLLRGFQALRSRERGVIVLRHYLGLSEREVAEALGTSVAITNATGRSGVTALSAFLETDASAPLAERDLLDLIDHAAQQPPRMQVAVSAVLATARAHRRVRRARTGAVVLTAVVLAAVAWVGLGPGIDDVGTDEVQRAERIEWDSTTDFETRLTTDAGLDWPGFGTALVRRPAGERNFSVELLRDGGTETVESVEGDLPEGVSVFAHGGHSWSSPKSCTTRLPCWIGSVRMAPRDRRVPGSATMGPPSGSGLRTRRSNRRR